MRPSRKQREAIDLVREGAQRYPRSRRDPYNLGLYLHDLTDHEAVLALRDTANMLCTETAKQRAAVAAQEDEGPRKKKRERSRSRSPPVRKHGKAKPCERCGVHDNSALAEAKGRSPSSAEWRQWRLDNPRHNVPSDDDEVEELGEFVADPRLKSPQDFIEAPEMVDHRDVSQ